MATVKDIFGESDSEEEEEEEEEEEDNILDDDDDDDDEGKKGTSAPRVHIRQNNKKRKEPVSSSSSTQQKQDKKKETTAYDSEEDDADVMPTEEDKAFIDTEGDDHELLAEYDKEKQNFDDERPEHDDFEQAVESSSEKVVEQKTPLTETLERMKKKRKKDMSQDDRDKVAMAILGRMNDAFLDDNDARAERKPALAKLQLLQVVKQVFAQRSLHTTLLEFDALVAVCDWLKPSADGTLASLAVRTAMLELMQSLPAQPEHLKKPTSSGVTVGRVVMKAANDARETPDNRRLARALVEKWSRPVVGKGVSYKGLEAQQEKELGLQVRSKSLSGSVRVDESKDDVEDLVLLADDKADETSASETRVRVPQFTGFDFTVRPAPSTEAVGSQGSQSRRASSGVKAHNPDTAKGRIAKKVKTKIRMR